MWIWLQCTSDTNNDWILLKSNCSQDFSRAQDQIPGHFQGWKCILVFSGLFTVSRDGWNPVCRGACKILGGHVNLKSTCPVGHVSFSVFSPWICIWIRKYTYNATTITGLEQSQGDQIFWAFLRPLSGPNRIFRALFSVLCDDSLIIKIVIMVSWAVIKHQIPPD